MASALLTLVSMVGTPWVKDHPTGVLCLAVALIIGSVGSFAFWIFTREKQPSSLANEGNFAGRDNLGKQFYAKEIHYHEAAAVAPPLSSQPSMEMTKPVQIVSIEIGQIRIFKARFDRNGWQVDRDGPILLAVVEVVYRLPVPGKRATNIVPSIAASLWYRNTVGFPAKYVSKAYWLDHPANVIDIPLGETRWVVLGIQEQNQWKIFENPYSQVPVAANIAHTWDIPFIDDDQFNHFSIELNLFSSLTGEVYLKHSWNITKQGSGFAAMETHFPQPS